MISSTLFSDRRILLIVFAFEALIFYNFYAREIAWYPPQNYDQTFYLTEVYRLQEGVHHHGLTEFWRELWRKNHASSLAFPMEGALLGLILPGSRLPQLCVLFLSFCALQVVAFATARALWGRRSSAYILLGLILSQSSLWFWAGGLFDYRMDFLAYCLYGIWACAVLRSNLFLDRRGAFGCGLIAGFLVINRFLSIIYVVGVPAGFAGVCLIIWFWRRDDADLARRLRIRLLNLGLFLLVLVIVALPILLINRGAIYFKYVVAQFYYEQDIRAQEFGIVGLSGHLLYYPISIFKDHLGPTFLWASAISITGSLAAWLLGRKRDLGATQATRGGENFLLQVIFLLGAAIGPIVVLTIDISKSPIIGGIVGVPVALLVGTLTVAIGGKPDDTEPIRVRNVIVVCSAVVFALGLFNQFDHAVRHLADYSQRRDTERLAELNRWMANCARENGWRKPTISFDVFSGSLHAGTITTSGYESLGELIEFQTTSLGSKIMGVDRTEALASIAKSDFLVLTDLPKTGIYPFYERISRYWKDLKEWADKNMITARTLRLDNFTVTVYVRPTAQVFGVIGNWITSDGLTIESSRKALQQFPVIRLSGSANYSWLPKVPNILATIDGTDPSLTVPASLRRTDDGYEIRLDLSSLELPPFDLVRIHLNFDTFFVPKKIGLNGDTRELVFFGPNLVQLMPRGS